MVQEEKFQFTSDIKKKLFTWGGIGLGLLVLGIILSALGGGHEAAHGATEGGGHHETHWYDRVFANLWINNLYFTGLAIIGVFFTALNYVSRAGWSAILKRIPEAFGAWLPIAGILMLGVFLIGGHSIFHWTHSGLYEVGGPEYDPIIAGKHGYLNYPFYIIRMVLYFGVWYFLYRLIRKESLAEDINGGLLHYNRMVKYSAIFIIIFAITSSTSAWDWVLSIDTHWFSTMFGWYVFSSWFVTGLAFITLVTVILKENGYLKGLSSEHLHDLGKYIFAFSIFWTYIWFSQFLLIYYANIPEETIYFVERLASDYYAGFFFANLFMNFVFPFLVLMTRDSKRITIFLKVVCVVVLAGHWVDFYMMVTPGIMQENGTFGLVEIGTYILYGSAFLFVVLTSLSKASLVAKNHPMLGESLHHHT